MNCTRTYPAVYLFVCLLFSVDNEDDKPLNDRPLDNNPPTEQNHLQSGFLVKTILQRTRGLPSSMTLMQYRPSSLQGFTEIDSSDLHTAYRLPIQRLSNTQLQLLLQKYEAQSSVQLTRTEMIEKLKLLISQKDKMLRPRLLTNVNVLNNPNAEMTLPNEPVVNLNELERTTLGPTISTSPPTDFNVEPEIQSLPILVDNDDRSSVHEIRRSHKRLPDDSSILTSVDNDKQDVENMRKKNNQLHSSYFEALSMDLERLKLKYDSMRLQLYKSLRRINERNVINASPTFVVPEKEDSNHSGAVDEKSAEFGEKTTTINSETTQNTQGPIGGAKIEEEILANRKRLLTTTIEQPIEEEVTPSSISNESKEDSEESQTPNISAFFNSADSETAPKTEESTISESNEPSTESTTPTIDGREIVDNESEHQPDGPTTTVGPIDFESTGTRRIHTANLNNIEGQLVENVTSERQEESSTIITNRNVIPPLSVVEAMTNIESEIMNPTLWKQQATEAGMERKLKVMLTRVNETITPDELINQLKEEAQTIDAQTSDSLPVNVEDKLTVVTPKPRPQVCDNVSCNFETGNFCRWKTSIDELNPTNRRNLHGNRKRRSTEYTLRSFQIWSGRHQNDNFGIARSNFFSLNNTKFASSYLRPFERSTLSVDLTNLNARSKIVQFHVWESVRNMQLRFCCGSTNDCVYETNLGVLKGTRRWLKQTSSCPSGTKRLIFECVNHGKYQGACGIDNIKLLNDDCSPSSYHSTALLDSDRLM
ncbi:hypothetical protein M3Y95_00119900 [Aphelenchoides besseyi]|nr:hypothetical protein M3Y95_00119900 [Aphelenchoides besseyi]